MTRRIILLMAGLVMIALLPEVGSAADLSLQIKEEGVDATAPEEAVEPVKLPYRYDRSIGGFGIGTGYFDTPADVAVNSKGRIYVLDAGNQRVQYFSSKDFYENRFGSSGSRPSEFKDPKAISVSAGDFVYVVDSGNHRIQKFDADGKFISEWGGLGTRTGAFNQPTDLAFDETSNLYVADPVNDRIQKFDANGKFIAEWNKYTVRDEPESKFNTLVSLAYDDDRFGFIMALSNTGKTIEKFELNGNLYETVHLTRPQGDFRPTRIEIDNEDDVVYIVDEAGKRVLRYGKDGSLMGVIDMADEELGLPAGMWVDRNDKKLYVVDAEKHKLQRYYMK
jgi:DNA-binding beta-propeller fold protein YncE